MSLVDKSGSLFKKFHCEKYPEQIKDKNKSKPVKRSFEQIAETLNHEPATPS